MQRCSCDAALGEHLQYPHRCPMHLVHSCGRNNSRDLELGVVPHLLSEYREEIVVHVVVTCAAVHQHVMCHVLCTERHALSLGCCKTNTVWRFDNIFIAGDVALSCLKASNSRSDGIRGDDVTCSIIGSYVGAALSWGLADYCPAYFGHLGRCLALWLVLYILHLSA